MAVNYVPFAEAVIEIVVELYRSTAKFPSVIHGHILQRIIHVRGCLLVISRVMIFWEKKMWYSVTGENDVDVYMLILVQTIPHLTVV